MLQPGVAASLAAALLFGAAAPLAKLLLVQVSPWLLAALGVFGTGSRWPDLLVAAVMAGLALTAGLSVVRQARRELETAGA